MPDAAWLEAGKSLRIPRSEISYRATRAGGPGGQHVNTSSTRIELWWNLEDSTAPGTAQRTLLRERLASRLDSEGWLRLVEAGSRSQLRNRETVTERFAALVARALTPRKARKPTKVPRAEKRRRLEGKRLRSGVKRMRGKVADEE
jgi:ribosome-associated protein